MSGCDALSVHDDSIREGQMISKEEATKHILGSDYACPDIGVDSSGHSQLQSGNHVSVEMMDATPGHHPQKGSGTVKPTE
ncbi:hypothetical protein LTS10_006370 [Elasticomyces elasticus]|nr:hypothetical protein LTS10_006370 [Elasticomyces elasticus]